jgi:hypothetical protein
MLTTKWSVSSVHSLDVELDLVPKSERDLSQKQTSPCFLFLCMFQNIDPVQVQPPSLTCLAPQGSLFLLMASISCTIKELGVLTNASHWRSSCEILNLLCGLLRHQKQDLDAFHSRLTAAESQRWNCQFLRMAVNIA